MIDQLRFYDGRLRPIDSQRLMQFELDSIVDKYYLNREIDAAGVIDDIGPIHIDFTNIQRWSKEIPDIDPRSARLFTLWAEFPKTNQVAVILRGFYTLIPFKFGEEALKKYYYEHDTPCYPMAIISSFRTIFDEKDLICDLLDRVKSELGIDWKKRRQQVIKSLPHKSELWKRYVLAFDKIIYYSFLCPSIDRTLIEALKRKNFRITGVMQLLASPTPSYNEVMIRSHLSEAKKLLQEKNME